MSIDPAAIGRVEGRGVPRLLVTNGDHVIPSAMHRALSNLVRDLTRLLPEEERELLLRLCAAAEGAGLSKTIVPREESDAAARLAAKLASAIRHEPEHRLLGLRSPDAARLLGTALSGDAETGSGTFAPDPALAMHALEAGTRAGTHHPPRDLACGF